jgi:hypothetical protein
MQRQVIKFQTGHAEVIRLDLGPDGLQTVSKLNGETQWQYTVNDGTGVMWLSAQARLALQRSGAQKGDDVRILKEQAGKGYIYLVDVIKAGAPPQQAQQVVNGAPLPTWDELSSKRPNPTNGNGAPAARALESQAALARHVTQQAEPEPAPAQPAEETTPAQRIGRRVTACGRIAIDSCREWTQYSAQVGMPIQFRSDDVRALAITLLIEVMRREGGR